MIKLICTMEFSKIAVVCGTLLSDSYLNHDKIHALEDILGILNSTIIRYATASPYPFQYRLLNYLKSVFYSKIFI